LFYTAPLHGFAFWFDVEFNVPTIAPTNNHSSTSVIENHQVNGSLRKKRANPSEALVLSTAPEDPPTHWQQVQIFLFYYLFPISIGISSFMFSEVYIEVLCQCLSLAYIKQNCTTCL